MSTTRWRSGFIRTALVALATAAALAGCSRMESGPVRTESRNVGDFHSVEVRGSADATVRVGPATSLSVTAGENMLAELTTEVRDGKLIVEQKRHLFWDNADVDLVVTTPALRAVTVLGAGNVEVHDARGESLRLGVNGAGNMTAMGEVDSLEVDINGAGNAELAGLKARKARAVLNGAGNLTVNASDELNAVVNGVGSVRYVGTPPKLDTQVNGVGDVSQVKPGAT
jgi:hypothetical protein